MASDAALYRSPALQAERARLVFNAALQTELRAVARHREVSSVPLATGPTFSTSGAVRPSKPVLPQGAGKSTEPGGWDVDRKMKALAELQTQLRRPFFFYLDFATTAAANGASGGLSKDIKLQFSFSKILPLQAGQTALLDLWDYLMDMCDLVPVRNRCRALYLQCAAYICRRVEFIDGYPLDGQQIRMDDEVAKRYYKLLERSVRYSASKMRKTRFLADEHRFFVVHVFASVFFRFPLTTAPILDAIMTCTESLEIVSDGPRVAAAEGKTAAPRPPRRRRRPFQVPAGSCRSPRGCRRDWNALSDDVPSPDRISKIDLQLEVFGAFSSYKEKRNTVRLATSKDVPGIPTNMVKQGTKSVDESLEATFQEMMIRVTKEQELTFIHALPLLYVGDKVQRTAFSRYRVSREVIEAGLEVLTEKLRTLGRDDLFAVSFVAAIVSDVSTWCSHRFPDGRTLWHCIPGYFAMTRLFVAVFQRMCQRRSRSGSTVPSVDRILSIIGGETVDPWVDYWNSREQDTVIDGALNMLKNEALLNVLIQSVLEGTNITDPASVNYSFGILQRVLEVAASAAFSGTERVEVSGSTNGSTSPKRRRYPTRRLVGNSFDADYFLGAMRVALQSSHVQILLKVLTCLYNCIDLLPTTTRKRLVAELLLRDNFFRFFLHWNEEIRKIFCYVIVFKTAISNRLDLPCASDRILLAQTPYFEKGGASDGSSSSYFAHLSEIAQAMVRGEGGASAVDAKKKAAIGKGALKRLIAWDPSAKLRRPRTGGGSEGVFRDSLGDEELSVDLTIASKLDALFKMTADQLNRSRSPEGNGKKPGSSRYFPRELEAYAESSLSQYVLVLCEYFDIAFKYPAETPLAPSLEFTITMPFFTD